MATPFYFSLLGNNDWSTTTTFDRTFFEDAYRRTAAAAPATSALETPEQPFEAGSTWVNPQVGTADPAALQLTDPIASLSLASINPVGILTNELSQMNLTGRVSRRPAQRAPTPFPTTTTPMKRSGRTAVESRIGFLARQSLRAGERFSLVQTAPRVTARVPYPNPPSQKSAYKQAKASRMAQRFPYKGDNNGDNNNVYPPPRFQ